VEDQLTAATLLMDEYMPHLARLGSRVGLGFHVPPDGPGPQGRRSIELLSLQPQVGRVDSQAEREPFNSRPDVPPGTQVVVDAGWHFEIALRLKLGEVTDTED
jgi:hypothetical protein